MYDEPPITSYNLYATYDSMLCLFLKSQLKSLMPTTLCPNWTDTLLFWQ